jgi:hypothetical protein
VTVSERVDRAAFALFRAAGRPDGLWADLSHHEREGWRVCVWAVLAEWYAAAPVLEHEQAAA